MSDQSWRERYNFPAEQELIQFLEANPGMYGSMMSIISQMWHEKDPVGAFTVGPCYRQVEVYGNYFDVVEQRDQAIQDLRDYKSKRGENIGEMLDARAELDRLRVELGKEKEHCTKAIRLLVQVTDILSIGRTQDRAGAALKVIYHWLHENKPMETDDVELQGTETNTD